MNTHRKEIKKLLLETENYEEFLDKLHQEFFVRPKRSIRIEVAKTEQIQFQAWIETNFMVRVLGIERWLVTDLSSLSDFWPLDDIEMIEGKGSEEGFFRFSTTLIDQKGIEKTNYWEAQPTRFREKVLVKSLDVFGVGIHLAFFEKTLPEMFKHIAERMPEEKQRECIAWHEDDLQGRHHDATED